MAVTVGETVAAAGFGPAASGDVLPMEGTLPDGFAGSFVQAVPHPAVDVAAERGQYPAGGPFVLSGVRFGEGVARWYRCGARAHRAAPLGPVPALAPQLWPVGGEGHAREVSCPVVLARPVLDPDTAEWHTVATYPGLGHAEHLVADPRGVVVRQEPFVLDGAPLVQAVALTRRYVIVFDSPVVHHRAAALVGVRFPFRRCEGRSARIGLLRRRSGGAAEPRWFTIGSGQVIDAVNAFDDGDQVVVDAVARPHVFEDVPGRPIRAEEEPTQVYRWRLNRGSGAAVRVRSLPRPVETAIVDDRVRGRRHRRLFGTGGIPGTGPAVLCHDLEAGTTLARELGFGLRVGGPSFVPRDRGIEGEGWLVVLVHDPVARRSRLLVLDALDVTGPLVVVVRLPVEMPARRRTTWLHDDRSWAEGVSHCR